MTRLLAAVLQKHGRAQITAAIGRLTGPAKKAAGEAFEKVAASKSGMAALQEPGTALEAAHTSTESSSTNGGSRPSSRGTHIAQVGRPALACSRGFICYIRAHIRSVLGVCP